MQYFVSVLLSILANVIFAILAVVFVGAVVTIRRKPLLDFFGVRTNRQLRIYTSHIRVPPTLAIDGRIVPNGTLGVDGQIRTFRGSSVPVGELQLLEPFYTLFNYSLPAEANLPGDLRNLLLTDVAVETSFSPLSSDEIDKTSSVVAFGSPGYNAVSGWIEAELHPLARFNADNASISVPGFPPFTDLLVGFVQRTRIANGPQVAFYLAGPSEPATRAALSFLVSRWQYLNRRYGSCENFVVLLKAHPTDHRRHEILLERGEQGGPNYSGVAH